MLSKSIIVASLLFAFAPSAVVGAPVQGPAAELEAREPMIAPAVHPSLLHTFQRRPIGGGRLRTRENYDNNLEARVIAKVHPGLLRTIPRLPIGGGLPRTREYDEDLETRLRLVPNFGHSSVHLNMHPSLRARELSEEEDLAARLVYLGIRPPPRGFKRDFNDVEDLEARQPIFGVIKRIGKGLFGRDIEGLEDIDAREWEELATRQPIFGIIKNIGRKIFGRDLEGLDDLNAREWEELETREPIFGIIKNIGRKIFGRDFEGLDELNAREWEELEARQPIFGIIKKIGKGIFGRDLEYSELEQLD